MKENIKGMLHYIRQAFGVSLVLMLVCGLLFPLLLSDLSAILFPHQAEGSLIEINGKAVAAENVGQEFTEDYYLWSRPSAYHYNVYIENADGTQTYQDGTEFSGIGSGSNNYAPSNPELVERVEADMAFFLEKNPDVKPEDIDVAWVPGAFEIPLIASKMAQTGKYDALICLCAVIRGNTSHYDYVCSEVSKGIAQVSLNQNLPVMFGVLTTENIEQAIERAGTKAGNKGSECAESAIEMINLIRSIEA